MLYRIPLNLTKIIKLGFALDRPAIRQQSANGEISHPPKAGGSCKIRLAGCISNSGLGYPHSGLGPELIEQ